MVDGGVPGGAMSEVVVRGQLICADTEEVGVVRRSLPLHLELTRAEPGCLSFEVRQTDDPHVWQVEERFADAAAYAAHRARMATSAWGRATVGIERRYVVEGVESGS